MFPGGVKKSQAWTLACHIIAKDPAILGSVTIGS